MTSSSGNNGSRTRKWVSKVRTMTSGLEILPLVQCLALLGMMDMAHGISYRKDTGFATDGMDQFVFREPPLTTGPSGANGPSPQTSSTVKRAGRVRFVDSPSEQYQAIPGASTYNRGTVDSVGGGAGSGFFGTTAGSGGSAPNGSPFPHRERERDQFYTVGASIQLAGGTADTITPPPPPVDVQSKPKRKKNKNKYTANAKIYTTEQEQGQFTPYGGFGGGQRYPTSSQDNYLAAGGRPSGGQFSDNSITNYPELQKQQYPFSMNSPYPGGSYYGGHQTPVGGPPGSGLSNPYQDQQQYQPQFSSPYAPEYSNPYQQPGNLAYYQQPQQAFGATGGQPPNAQSILGALQSIFNFAPGTFGLNAAPTQTRPGSQYSPAAPSPFVGGVGGVGGQLRQALDNISENDELQCVPKLVCMMSRSSSGQGFSIVNRGLLSTILGAVPDSSPWLKFSRAALLGYGIGANSCDAYYPKCPKDEMEILYYLNNHRGGFFRFFSNGEQGPQQQQQYG